MDRKIGKWLYHNFAAGSFHTKKLCSSRLYSIEIEFYSKNNKKSLFETPFGGLRDNVGLRTPSVARWKACGRLSIRRDWTFSAISYGWDVISGNLSKSAFFEGMALWAQISDGRGRRPPTSVGTRKLHCVLNTFELSVTLSNLNRFSKFLHYQKAYEICYKTVQHYPPHLRHVATLPWATKNSFSANIQ